MRLGIDRHVRTNALFAIAVALTVGVGSVKESAATEHALRRGADDAGPGIRVGSSRHRLPGMTVGDGRAEWSGMRVYRGGHEAAIEFEQGSGRLAGIIIQRGHVPRRHCQSKLA